jgi:predicted SnoaL-like aldol condensation-catalyzing enzyme
MAREHGNGRAITVGEAAGGQYFESKLWLHTVRRRRLVMSPARMSKFETAIRMVLQFNKAFNRHDVAGMMQLMTDDCIFENTDPAPDGTLYSGKEAVTQFWQNFFRESPNAHIEIEEIFSIGLRCVMRWRYEWADGAQEKGHVRGVDIFKLKDGLICEKLSYVKG